MKFHTWPIRQSACLIDIPILAAPRVRTFESFEIFTEVYLRIPFILDMMLHCLGSWFVHVDFVRQGSRYNCK